MPTREEKQKIAIIGGGLTGLVAGYRLSESGFNVHIFEAETDLGGMIRGIKIFPDHVTVDSIKDDLGSSDPTDYGPGSSDSIKDDLGSSDANNSDLGYIDNIYHHLFTSDSYLLQLLDDLELKSRLQWKTAANALMYEYKLYPFSTPLDLLNFKPLPFSQRLRTGFSVLKASRLKNWQPLEDELASDWLRRNCGEEAWRILWRPLLRSKFGSDAADISAVWIWNKFKLRGSSREGSKEKLGYLEGGFQQIADRLMEKITENGGQVKPGQRVTKIVRHNFLDGRSQFRVRTETETCAHSFDQIICTMAAEPFLQIASDLIDSSEYLDKLSCSEYKANLCLSVVYEKPLSPWYWTTICDDLPFVVAVEQDNLSRNPLKDGYLIYLSGYLGVEEEIWQKSDRDITNEFIRAAAKAFPGAKNNKVLASRLVRTRYSQPVIKRHYSKNMPEIKTPVPGLWLAGMAQIYPEDRGMNYALRLAEDVAAAVMGGEND
jgi:protoporphyrinogen oxidase